MYCDKLMNIVKHSLSTKHLIGKEKVQMLDLFIKEKTTLRERATLNPIRLTIESGLDQKSALMIFVVGTRCELFQMRAFYNCKCEEQFEIYSMSEITSCTCGRGIVPSNNRERVFLYFNLLEKPTECEMLYEEEAIFQTDFINENELGNGNFTMADLDSISDKGEFDNLVSQREQKMKEFNRRSYIEDY